MIISRPRPKNGIRFAWLPVRTPEGKVWLEDVHFEWQEHGFGGYTYERVHYKTDSFGLPKIDYSTPADPQSCRYYNPNGPTPCHHPHCDCPMPSPETVRFMGADPL